MDKSISEYWNKRSKDKGMQQSTRIGIPKLYIPGQAFDKVLEVILLIFDLRVCRVNFGLKIKD